MFLVFEQGDAVEAIAVDAIREIKPKHDGSGCTIKTNLPQSDNPSQNRNFTLDKSFEEVLSALKGAGFAVADLR